ncbi:protein kinase domain-containing protein [Colwellia sp. MEBiC06753]
MDETTIKIDGYQIKQVLGHGGMATVYLAIQNSFERDVAIKVMAEQLSSDPAFGERFLREAKIVSRLVHPNIVTVYDVGVVNNHHYLSMEYIEGDDLKNRLHSISLFHILKVIKEIALALDYAGRKGYVHRDIKPENIMINNEDGRAVLMDFGIAKAFDTVSEMTQTGTAIGTPYYMSPEQAKGKEIDWRSDLYSLGVVFYQLLVGEVPYNGDSAVSVGIKHLSDPIPKIPDYLQASFQEIIERLMAKVPDDRFQNGSELVSALNQIPSQQLNELNELFAKHAEREKTKPLDYHSGTVAASSDTGDYTMVVSKQITDETQVIDFKSIPQQSAVNTNSNKNETLIYASIISVIVVIAIGGYWFYNNSKQQLEEPLTTQAAPENQLATKTQTTQPLEVADKGNNQASTNDIVPVQSKDNQAQQYQPSDSPIPAQESEQDKKNKEKLAKLVAQAESLEQELDSSIDVAEELYQTYQFISLLADNHPTVVAGKNKLQKAYLNSINQHLSQTNYADASQLLKSTLRKYPELKQSEQVTAISEKIQNELYILSLIESAESHLAKDQLTGDDDNNAYHDFKKILEINPQHPAANKGLLKISDRYYQLAKAQFDSNNLQRAKLYTDKGLITSNNKHESLLVLRENIDQAFAQIAQEKAQNKALANQITLAQQQLTLGNILPPDSNNAYQAFRDILVNYPENPEAIEGLYTIEQALIKSVPEQIANKQFEQAKATLLDAAKFFPESTAITTFNRNLVDAEQAQIEASKPRISVLEVKGQAFTEISSSHEKTISADRTIFIGFEFSNFSPGTNVVQASLFDGSQTVKISTVPVILTEENGTKFFKISKPVDGFAEGGYILELTINNEKLASERFAIEN